MTSVTIDRLLLRDLRRDGLGDGRIAAACVDIRDGADERARRELGGLVSGDVSCVDGCVQAPVPIAPGVHWCGGTLQMVASYHAIPDTVAMNAVGRRLRDVIDHPDLPDDAVVTDVTSVPDPRFHAVHNHVSHLASPPALLLLHTNAGTATLTARTPARPFHRLKRHVDDRIRWETPPNWLIVLNGGCMLIVWAMATLIIHACVHSLPLAVALAIMPTLLVFMLLLKVGEMSNDRSGTQTSHSHLLFLRVTQDRQREQGMWGVDEQRAWLAEQ